MKTLYHGSYLEVTHPIARAGRKNLDFGQGFYLTTIREQAEAWARIISTRRGRSVNPVVSVFRFSRDQETTVSLLIKSLRIPSLSCACKFHRGVCMLVL